MTQVRACSANTELLGGTGREDLHTDCHFKEQKCLGKGKSGDLVPHQNSGKMMLSERWMDSRHVEYAGTFQFMRLLDHRKLKVSLENILVIE